MPKQSLAAQAGALQEPFQMPPVFQEPSAPVVARQWPALITFAHPKRADEWAKIQSKFSSVAEGDMYLIANDRLERLDPAKLTLLCCRQYWAEVSPTGEALRVSFEETPFKEHVEAVVLCYLDDRIIPANVQFRRARCLAARQLNDALIECQSPEWGQTSPAHRESMVCSQAFMRYYGLVTVGPPRTSKKSGMPYRPASAVVRPTGMAEWRLLAEFTKDPTTQKLLDDCARRYQERIEELTKKLVK